MSLQFRNMGLVPYDKALQIQQNTHKQVLDGHNDTVLFCEHPHVYTLGKSADKNNLLISSDFLQNINAEVYETERGGDITYHGPGQLVGYPIINLKKNNIGVKKYVTLLEESIMKTLHHFNILAYQIDGLTGIWVGEDNETKRKIGAIGIRVKNGISMHGFALNVSTSLDYFGHIVPCGISDKQVTSVQKEKSDITLDQVRNQFVSTFEQEWFKNVDL